MSQLFKSEPREFMDSLEGSRQVAHMGTYCSLGLGVMTSFSLPLSGFGLYQLLEISPPLHPGELGHIAQEINRDLRGVIEKREGAYGILNKRKDTLVYISPPSIYFRTEPGFDSGLSELEILLEKERITGVIGRSLGIPPVSHMLFSLPTLRDMGGGGIFFVKEFNRRGEVTYGVPGALKLRKLLPFSDIVRQAKFEGYVEPCEFTISLRPKSLSVNSKLPDPFSDPSGYRRVCSAFIKVLRGVEEWLRKSQDLEELSLP